MWLKHFSSQLPIILHICAISFSKTCVTKYTNAALDGYRCIMATEMYRNVTDVRPHMCTHICMTSKDCSITIYNIPGKFCLIGKDACIALQKDTDYQVRYISIRKRGSCIKWVSKFDFIQGNFVASTECDVNGAQRPCYVGRLKLPTNILPGKYHLGTNGPEGVWTILNGRGYTIGNMEVLDVQYGCLVTWMPFNSGDPVPLGAVVGGYLASRDSKLYVMRGMVQHAGNMYTVFGYYDDATEKGYLEYFGARIVMEMDILILIWNTRSNYMYL